MKFIMLAISIILIFLGIGIAIFSLAAPFDPWVIFELAVAMLATGLGFWRLFQGPRL